MAQRNERPQGRPRRQLPFNPNPERDINILLLGETGVGKSTFINAFVNYLIYDTLDAALQGDMQVLIPSAFAVSEADTHTLTTITIGSPNDNETGKDDGQSQTKGCKSYLFSIGDRYLRLIDTPGIGDCRGVEQDNKNFDHILAFVSRYEHLNGICILLKPNENRLNIFFKYGTKELLKHLHVNAKDNIMFIFTNARTNFFTPGATATQLKLLLDELAGTTTNIRIPFDKGNTFLFDNESFRFLAVCNAGHEFFMKHKVSFVDSWDRSVAEFNGLLVRIVKCDLHAVRDMESLNEARQLIRKLTRPIGEIATLIAENIQLAQQHKSKVLANSNDIIPNRIPQKTAEVVRLDYPLTVCTSTKCSKVISVNGEMKVDYAVKCHKHCHLKGVEQEVVNNPVLKHCRAMDKATGICKECDCDWSDHMHVTYRFNKTLTYIELNSRRSSRSSESTVSNIDKQIEKLKEEQEKVRHICAKLTLFLRVNSLSPTNEDVIEYINHFIREEKQKQGAGDDNGQVIRNLETMIKDYQDEVKLLRASVNDEASSSRPPTAEEIFELKQQLFQLPITGKYIEEQIERLKLNQLEMIGEREEYVDLTWSDRYSANMRLFQKAVK